MSRFTAPSETSHTATTPVPFSPFSVASDFTATSEGKSDSCTLTRSILIQALEPADLGAFSTIFRALTQLQRPSASDVDSSLSASSRSSGHTPSASPLTYATTDLPPDTTEDESDVRHFHSSSSSSSSEFFLSEAESDAYVSDIFSFAPSSPSTRRSRSSRAAGNTPLTQNRDRDTKRVGTVWNEDPVASYLSPTRTEQTEDTALSSIELPSLGAFESALSFLASERARLTTKLQRDTNKSPNSALSSPQSRIPGYHSPPVFPITSPLSFRTSTEPSPIAASPLATKGKKKQNRKGRKERERTRAENAPSSNGVPVNHLRADASSSNDSSEGRQARPFGQTTRNGSGAEPTFRHQSTKKPTSKQPSPINGTPKIQVEPAGDDTAAPDMLYTAIDDEAPLSGVAGLANTPALDNADTHHKGELRTHLLTMASRLREQFPADSRLLSTLSFDLDRFTTAGGFLPRDEEGGGMGIGRDGSSGYWENNENGEEKGKVHVFIDQ